MIGDKSSRQATLRREGRAARRGMGSGTRSTPVIRSLLPLVPLLLSATCLATRPLAHAFVKTPFLPRPARPFILRPMLACSSKGGSTGDGREWVVSPKTGRQILVGGPTFVKLVGAGGFMLRDRELVPVPSADGTHSPAGTAFRTDGDEACGHNVSPSVATAGAVPGVAQPLHGEGHLQNHGWRALHVDDAILIIEKAGGLCSVPGVRPETHDCLLTRVQARFPGARIVHRLDRDTSGVMVIARNADAHRTLSMAFERREVDKTYLALVAGLVRDENDVWRRSVGGDGWRLIDLPIGKDTGDKTREKPWVRRMCVDHTAGRSSRTFMKPLWLVGGESAPAGSGEETDVVECSLVALKPMTGRSHQLRVHMHAAGETSAERIREVVTVSGGSGREVGRGKGGAGEGERRESAATGLLIGGGLQHSRLSALSDGAQ